MSVNSTIAKIERMLGIAPRNTIEQRIKAKLVSSKPASTLPRDGSKGSDPMPRSRKKTSRW